ncbi:MAG: hypothetical protein LBH31_10415 [Burkholderiaceae bacterium]|nr:hypothetical protein [Burkholderiaceae bacterium]
MRTFFRQPLALGALTILFLIALTFLGLVIPVAGSILALVLTPALTVGLMAAARAADEGNLPLPPILFIAFRQGPAHARAIVALGLLYAAAIMVIISVFMLIGSEQLITFLQSASQQPTPEQFEQQAAALAALIGNPAVQIALLVALALYALVWIAFWYAPALVYWHGVPPVKSLFFSTVAVLKNTRAFLLYGTLWVGITLGANLILLAVATQAGSAGLVFMTVALPLLGLIITAMFFTSQWFSFRDSFVPDAPPLSDMPSAG